MGPAVRQATDRAQPAARASASASASHIQFRKKLLPDPGHTGAAPWRGRSPSLPPSGSGQLDRQSCPAVRIARPFAATIGTPPLRDTEPGFAYWSEYTQIKLALRLPKLFRRLPAKHHYRQRRQRDCDAMFPVPLRSGLRQNSSAISDVTSAE